MLLLRCLRHRSRWWRIGALLLFALLWQWSAWPLVDRAYAVTPPPGPLPRVLLVTSLPLDGAPGLTERLHGADARTPALIWLERMTRLRRANRIDAATLATIDVLLLAHPQALAPADLVAIDTWVRGGGRAILLADGLSSWPPPHPLGDPRNPPVTSLLSPIVTHWGLRIDAPAGLESRVEWASDSSERIAFLSAGQLVREEGACAVSSGARIARCPIGRGQALIVADADFLSADLWAGRAHRDAGNARRWQAGNMLWLLDRLYERDAESPALNPRVTPARPVWTVDPAA
jgi:hypothetical protein